MAEDLNPISVLETIKLFDGDFETFSNAFINGEYSVWMGSGISHNVPSLGDLISRAINHLREKYIEEGGTGAFSAALSEALSLTSFKFDDLVGNFDTELSEWPESKDIIDQIWNKYSELLNILIDSEAHDYMLWNAVGVREAFEGNQEPSCEHLCIAILILEGAITKLASANWDGCLENAITKLAGSTEGILQVVVDPFHLRDTPCTARLLKFHGCVVHATQDPENYRSFLTANTVSIMQFADRPGKQAIYDSLLSLVSETRTMTAGLSLQDANLLNVFSRASSSLQREWPSDTPALVFCEEKSIQVGQSNTLRITYGDPTYVKHKSDILRQAHLQSWPQKVFPSLVLKLLLKKLLILADYSLKETKIYPEFDKLSVGLVELQQHVANSAIGDLDAFVSKSISIWSRLLSLFRDGKLSTDANMYREISRTPLPNLLKDMNAIASGFGELALGLSLIGAGLSRETWKIGLPESDRLSDGAFMCLGNWEGAQKTSVFFVKSASEAVRLEEQGALLQQNAVVIHSDDTWEKLNQNGLRKSSRSPGSSVGRDGIYTVRHVSLAALMVANSEFDQVNTSFIEAVTI